MNATAARQIMTERKQTREEILKWIEIMAHNGSSSYFTRTKLDTEEVEYYKSLGFTVNDPLTEPNSSKISW